MPNKYTPEFINEVLTVHIHKGMSQTLLGKEFGVPKGTIRKWIDKYRTGQIEVIHAHHWMLPSPDGPTVKGTCKFCGTTKEFYNSSENNLWKMSNKKKRPFNNHL
ncbi:hypothetical protein CMI37_00360 [Candidatus Pacearchaeota archaeon]|nr:hypothetical protein [Candidatus Pacearchaeota archaeon]|tara:strand:- start:1424 stop:1738 length:315 start_codon:yes stop_codon:yes gene_type:complete